MRFALLLTLALAACGEPAADNRFSNSVVYSPQAPDAVTIEAQPVRIGELGPSFAACTAAGTTRRLESGGTLAVRAAPFDGATQSAALASGARFFICTRSLDQKWLGIVFDQAGDLSARCGVSDPIAARQNYPGPCGSGWVSTPFVKMIAGDDSAPAANFAQALPVQPAAPPAP